VTDAELDELQFTCEDAIKHADVDCPGEFAEDCIKLIAEVKRMRPFGNAIAALDATRAAMGAPDGVDIVEWARRLRAAERLAEAVDAWDRDFDAGGTLAPFAEHIQAALEAWRNAR
jgi:hypothetical protein